MPRCPFSYCNPSTYMFLTKLYQSNFILLLFISSQAFLRHFSVQLPALITFYSNSVEDTEVEQNFSSGSFTKL